MSASTGRRAAVRPVQRGGLEPIVGRYDRPVLFYLLATAIPWACWLVAAYLSHRPEQGAAVRAATAVLGVVGLAAPLAVVAWLLRRQPEVWADIRRRLLWRPGTRPGYVACAVLLLPASILAAQAISLLFGYSPEQFLLRDGFSFSAGLLPAWVVLGLAAVLEELAWHSYGTDALVSRMRVLSASLLFVVVWALWHLPLSLIQGYYHEEVVQSGWLHALNFPLSMIPFVVLMNWLYFRTGRNISVAIVFHLVGNYANEVFRTDPDSKLIQTALLLVLTVVVVVRERDLFLTRPADRVPPG